MWVGWTEGGVYELIPVYKRSNLLIAMALRPLRKHLLPIKKEFSEQWLDLVFARNLARLHKQKYLVAYTPDPNTQMRKRYNDFVQTSRDFILVIQSL